MTNRFAPPAIALLVAVGLTLPEFAHAQGNGRPKSAKAPATTSTTSTASASTTLTPMPVSTFRQFGAWLDDASAESPGGGYASIGIGHWRMLGSSQTNMPMAGVGVGVTDRMQVGASVPYYHARFEGGSASGMDDVYLSAKYTIVDPTLTISEFGLAVTPLVEVLSAGYPDGRVHFGLPVSMELRRQPFRVYGSAGWFSRGSLFAGAALEWSASRMILTGSLTNSYSLRDDAVLDSLGIERRRADVSFGVAFPVADSVGAFANVGRSLTPVEEGGTSLALSGGMTFRFSARATP